jgi:hypothetical protein
VKLFRAFTGFAMVLGAVGFLRADIIPDPIIKLSIPGGHSVDITCVTDGCSTDIGVIAEDGFSNANPNPLFPDDKSFGIHNATGLDINRLLFHIQTDNVFQPFTANTNDFTTVEISISGEGFGGTVNIDYFGKEVGGTPGSDFLQQFCDFGSECPTAVGFTPGSHVFVDAFFGDPPFDPGCCDAFLNDEHAGLELLRDTPVPEPGSFVLLLGAGGLLALKRKFYRR